MASELDKREPRPGWEYRVEMHVVRDVSGTPEFWQPRVYGRPAELAHAWAMEWWDESVKNPDAAAQLRLRERLVWAGERFGAADDSIIRARYELASARRRAQGDPSDVAPYPNAYEPFEFEYHGERVRCFVPAVGASASEPSRYDPPEWAYEIGRVEYGTGLDVDLERSPADERARVTARVTELLGGPHAR